MFATPMNHLHKLAALTLLLPLAAGCAGRTAPFNEMDQAQITVLRLGQPPAPTPTVTPQAAGLPQIPGIPAELQQMGQQALQGLQQALPPGMIPPGLIPGTQQQQTTPVQPATPQFKGFSILAQMPVTDDKVKDEILDLFGDEDNFTGQRGTCFTPGMGVAITRPNAAPIELLISISCNQAVGDGFQWPYPNNGFSNEARQRATDLYQKLWGPLPPGA